MKFIKNKTYETLNNAVKYAVGLVNAQTLQIRDLAQGNEGKRDTYDIYGYPEEYQFRNGYKAIRREGVANRVVAGVAKSCWRNGFRIVDNLDDMNEQLENEIIALNKAQLFSRLERADILNRVGRYSVLLVGIPDGQDFDQPLGKARGNALASIYFRPFAYDGSQVARWDMDEQSPRYGMPDLYQLSIKGRGVNEQTVNNQTIMVHHSRVIHMAETLLDSDVEGIPALEPIYNRTLDLDKVLGGSAEAYFRNARGKMAFEVDPEFSTQLLNNPSAKAAFDEAAMKFTNDWQDQIVTVGAKASSMETPHQSPLDTAKSILWEISGYTGIPLRMLTGEGAGQLAGSEDRLSYNALINNRQHQTCSMWVNRLLEILSDAGIVTLPESYEIDWPLEEPLNEIDKANIAGTKATTLKTLTEAASTVGGDGINLESALEHFGLDEIGIEEAEEFEDVDDDIMDDDDMMGEEDG